ncbi:ATP-dependent metalloprotease FtsH [Rhodomicrobium vannielii ATCC 17100]|uniref:ATP-dependent zinc metalloprotease FtsH n=1 Tax=Rhodomicrobium vannielii (strain ATCC 17100 / DSM 162 / LMG 4299 / NCIMB 10020 / ATH 3.1.1) TaxID=648757 RepID=E3HZA1_RHOVT|nr:ATP-dependent zinc metalloprotease FtsH [Rhodomicrobium vannielii]ADP69847.1 ATP-dependent metalloprotease FtsH [Rhodomicrobium vannielii ATCC 17100]
MDKKNKLNLTYMAVALGLLLLFQVYWANYNEIEPVPYSRYQQLLRENQLTNVVVGPSQIRGEFKTPQDGKKYFATTRVDPAVATELEKQGIEFSGSSGQNIFRDIASWVLPIFIFFAIWAFFIRRMGDKQGIGGLMSVGKSRAKIYVEKVTGVGFEDVAGADEAKGELMEIVNFLKDPDHYGRLGARVPKGILLVGPPGIGKTLLARAVAGEAGVPFFSISGSEFVEMFVGVGAARVRDLFEQARKMKPCIIFIDELDSLGRSRAAGMAGGGGNDEKEQTLNQLLAELDGFDPREGIVLLAATNRPEILDPALTRAGRFDRQIALDRPDKNARIAILGVHIKRIKAAKDVDLEQVAGITPGFSGADLANLVNEAALGATRRGAEHVTMDDFTRAVERLVAGIEKRSRVLSKKEREVVAHHEMGHALVASALPGVDPVHKVSIIPRGIGALGYTMQRPTEDRFVIQRGELINRMTVLMGGRAAEEIIFGEISTGAADDIDRATDIARQMVTRFGMIEGLGQRVYEPQRQAFLGEGLIGKPKDYSDQTNREIDLAVKKLVDDAYANAKKTLNGRRKDLDEGTALLLAKETITPDDFPPLVNIAPGQKLDGSSPDEVLAPEAEHAPTLS